MYLDSKADSFQWYCEEKDNKQRWEKERMRWILCWYKVVL